MLAIVAGALAFPAVASAGTITADHVCYEQGKTALISGSGFTPNLSLPFVGEQGDTSAQPDSNGAFTNQPAGVPDYNSYTPRSFTITAMDQVTPANNASVTLMDVKFGSNLPVGGKHAQVTTWQFGGFPQGATIYAHFRYGHNGPFHTVKDVRFGTAAGPCGVLTKKAMRIPIKNPKRGGGWFVQVDTHPKYHSSTETFFVFKTFAVR